MIVCAGLLVLTDWRGALVLLLVPAADCLCDDGWGVAGDNWPGHQVASAISALRKEEPVRTEEVTAQCIVELYRLQAGIPDREQHHV